MNIFCELDRYMISLYLTVEPDCTLFTQRDFPKRPAGWDKLPRYGKQNHSF